MIDFSGACGLVVGVANRRSIAWAIAQRAAQSGAKIALTYQDERLRENAISAGPIKTLAASGIAGFSDILQVYRDRSPLRRNTETSEVASLATLLLSPAGQGITGEVIFVDGGYHVMGT